MKQVLIDSDVLLDVLTEDPRAQCRVTAVVSDPYEEPEDADVAIDTTAYRSDVLVP